MTTIKLLTRHVTKNRKRTRAKEYRLQFTSKGRVTFVTPQWYSRLADLSKTMNSLIKNIKGDQFDLVGFPEHWRA